MAKILLVAGDGRALGELPQTVEEILAEAEQRALADNLPKRSIFPSAVRQEIEAAGYRVEDVELTATMPKFDAVRRGERMDTVRIQVRPSRPGDLSRAENKERSDMAGKPPGNPPGHRFFESELAYPDPRARARYNRLVGLDEHKRRLLLELELLLYPDRLAGWSRQHHGMILSLCELYADRPPLVLLEGDVGCGKTVLAETVGDALAERVVEAVRLLKVNTQVRGTGLVGEMTELIVQAFAQTEARAEALGGAPVLLLIDEADTLASRRDEQHMHHEDKAGLNTLLQRIDGLRRRNRRVAVLFVTNRPDVLDPAVRRRAALRLTFTRPGDDDRRELFRRLVPELRLTSHQLSELVKLTGPQKKGEPGCTPSDITNRILAAAVREAYAAGRPLTGQDLIEQAREVRPTPSFGSSDGRE